MPNYAGPSETVYLVILIFLIILAVLWFLLPFAVFGIKDKLNRVVDRLDLVLARLDRIANATEAAKKQP